MKIDHRRTVNQFRGASLSDRFWAKVILAGDGCWEWTGTRNRDGYARFSIASGNVAIAYRWSYEQMVGEIPEGLELDHLCHNRLCVNPYHLDPVTRDENTRRAQFRRWGSSVEMCPNGHPRTLENQVKRSKPRGRSGECKVCNRERMQRKYASQASS